MVTITVNTGKEYDEMWEFALTYLCRQRSLPECGKYPPNSCDKCFKDNHTKCGIRIILSKVDRTKHDKL